jgi:hypothetical protein
MICRYFAGVHQTAMTSASLILSFALALTLTACSSSEQQQAGPPTMPNMKMSLAAPGSCNIDAAKMCSSLGTLSGQGAPTASQAAQTTYANATAPESIDFQIPAGQPIKLLCYYDQQRTKIVRADATPESPLTDNSVSYLKSQGFCTSK